MKRILAILAVAIVLFLVLPITNLLAGLPESSLALAQVDDPHYRKALRILGRKCVNCHTEEYELPFYAKLPVAKGIVTADIEKGTEWMDYGTSLLPAAGAPVSPVVLAKTARVLEEGAMPPGRYLMLHWNGGLSDEEEADLRGWIEEYWRAHHTTDPAAEYATYPLQPLPREVDLDEAKVALGDALFHDTRLSGDDTLSCASCHDLGKGGCDRAPVATGVGGTQGPINSPTVFNSGWQIRQFWDGRAVDLEEQAAGPVANPLEMADEWPAVVAQLREDADLVARFEGIYPDGLTQENVLDAIATFEKSLVTPDCAVDRYLRGDAAALTPDEREGLELFTATGCATCHSGLILGGASFERMGRAEEYFEGETTEADQGRVNFTRREIDRHKFKVPTLRNIELTHPYFHDASTSDLSEAVRIMARCELDAELTDREVGKVVAFLKALTGSYRGKKLE